MGDPDSDPFVSKEPEIELDPEISRLIEARIKSAESGHLVSNEDARRRIEEWLAKSLE